MSYPRRKVFLTALAGLVGAAGVLAWSWLRDATPLLTPAALAGARSAWQKAGIADYDLTLRKEVDTGSDETIETQARGGKITRLLINGAKSQPTDSYSVAGLFELLETELELAASKNRLPGQPRNAILKAQFDSVLGIPVVVRRLAPDRQSFVIHVLHVATPDQLFLWKDP